MKKLDEAKVAAAIKKGESYAAISKAAGGKPGDGTYNAVRKIGKELAKAPAKAKKAGTAKKAAKPTKPTEA